MYDRSIITACMYIKQLIYNHIFVRGKFFCDHSSPFRTRTRSDSKEYKYFITLGSKHTISQAIFAVSIRHMPGKVEWSQPLTREF